VDSSFPSIIRHEVFVSYQFLHSVYHIIHVRAATSLHPGQIMLTSAVSHFPFVLCFCPVTSSVCFVHLCERRKWLRRGDKNV